MKISRGPMGLLFVAMLAMVTTDVMAQREGGGRPGGGRPGGGRTGGGGFRGGFGGGFSGGRGGGGLAGLLRIEQVREEIELMPDQEEALKKVSEDRPRFERPEGIDFRDQSEENQKKLQAFIKKVQKQRVEAEEKLRDQLEEILLPEQLERLEQLEVRQMRTAALMNARVVAALKLTTEQQEDLKKKSEAAREELMSKMRELFRGGGGEGMREKMEAATKETEEKLLSVLTSDQKKEFEELKGEDFEFPRPERGSFGGRGGGDRGGPGGGDRGGRGGRGGGDRGGRGGRGGGRPAAE